MTKTITVQVPCYVTIEVEVTDTNEETIINACYEDLKNEDSNNDWEVEFETLKSSVRDAKSVETLCEDEFIIK